jgi:hypothetical protein
MPIDQAKIDRLTELLFDQTLAEFEAAVVAGLPIDPRRLANARALLESTSSRALEPKTAPVVRDAAGKIVKPADEAPKGTPENPWPGQRFLTAHQLKIIADYIPKEEDSEPDARE